MAFRRCGQVDESTGRVSADGQHTRPGDGVISATNVVITYAAIGAVRRSTTVAVPAGGDEVVILRGLGLDEGAARWISAWRS